MEQNKVVITEGLRQEVVKTLIWFADTDIEMRGKITEDTLDAFKMQKVELPVKYKKFI